MRQIIGFVGKRRSGKDTAARILTQIGYESVKFAGALKEMLRTYLRYVGVEDSHIEEMVEGGLKEMPNAQFCDQSCRWAMQTLGTEWGRDLIGKELWVNAAIARCLQFDHVVVTDARFPNEVAALKNIGAKIIRIKRPGPQTYDTHESEILISSIPVDFEIINDSTIDVLHQKVLQLINK